MSWDVGQGEIREQCRCCCGRFVVSRRCGRGRWLRDDRDEGEQEVLWQTGAGEGALADWRCEGLGYSWIVSRWSSSLYMWLVSGTVGIHMQLPLKFRLAAFRLQSLWHSMSSCRFNGYRVQQWR